MFTSDAVDKTTKRNVTEIVRGKLNMHGGSKG